MVSIERSNCPNLNGRSHTTDNPLVPRQLKHAHLHPLRSLGTKNPAGDLTEKVPAVSWGTHEEDLGKRVTRYGVCLTRSNIFVVDIDRHGSVDGVATFEELCKEAGEEIPNTFTVASPNAGFHYYFLAEENPLTGNKKTNLWPGVDVFPVGQQVVGPGSSATKADGSGVGYYEVSNDTDIAPMPAWLLAKIVDAAAQVGPAKKKNPKHTRTNAVDFTDLSKTHQDQLELYARQVTATTEGRNEACYEAGKAAIRAGIPRAAAEKHLLEAARSLESTDFSLVEAEQAISNGLDKGVQEEVPADFYRDRPMAERFLEHLGGHVKFVSDRKVWRGWDSSENRWVELPNGDFDILRNLNDWIRKEKDEAIASENTKRLNQAEELDRSGKPDAILRLALPYLAAASSLFDSHKHLRGMKNCIYNLATGERLEHDPKYMLTKQMGANYTEATQHELVKLLLQALPTSDQRRAQMFWFGQALNSDRPASAAFLNLWGHKRNGKSSIIEMVMKAAGNYAKVVNGDALLPSKDANAFGMVEFRDTEIAIVMEPDGEYLTAGPLKTLTGDASFDARAKNEKNQRIDNTVTLLVVTNHKLKTKYHDTAVDDRNWPVNYCFYFTSDPSVLKNNPMARKPNPHAATAKESQEAVDVFGSMMVRFASQWYREFDKKALEEKHLAAFAAEKREYLLESNRMLKVIDTYLTHDSTCAIAHSDLKKALTDFWGREFASANLDKQKLLEAFEKTDWYTAGGVKKTKARFNDSRKRSAYQWKDRDGHLVSDSIDRGVLYVGVRFKVEADEALDLCEHCDAPMVADGDDWACSNLSCASKAPDSPAALDVAGPAPELDDFDADLFEDTIDSDVAF